MVRLHNNTRQHLTINILHDNGKPVVGQPAIRIDGLGYCDVSDNVVKSKVVQKYLRGSKPTLRIGAVPAKKEAAKKISNKEETVKQSSKTVEKSEEPVAPKKASEKASETKPQTRED